jgi:hypothetical protein
MKISILSAAIAACALTTPVLAAQEVPAPAAPSMRGTDAPQSGTGVTGSPQDDPRAMGGAQAYSGSAGGYPQGYPGDGRLSAGLSGADGRLPAGLSGADRRLPAGLSRPDGWIPAGLSGNDGRVAGLAGHGWFAGLVAGHDGRFLGLAGHDGWSPVVIPSAR